MYGMDQTKKPMKFYHVGWQILWTFLYTKFFGVMEMKFQIPWVIILFMDKWLLDQTWCPVLLLFLRNVSFILSFWSLNLSVTKFCKIINYLNWCLWRWQITLRNLYFKSLKVKVTFLPESSTLRERVSTHYTQCSLQNFDIGTIWFDTKINFR